MLCLNERNSNFVMWIIFMLFAIQTIQTFTILAEIPPPPTRPTRFQNREELKRYLQRVHEYYAIVGRPRFGRSFAMEQYPQIDRTLFQLFDTNDDNSIASNEFDERLNIQQFYR